METIEINSIEDVDQYIDQLKDIKVWLCHPGCGKSCLCKIDDRFFDLDEYRTKLRQLGVEDYDAKVFEKMQNMLDAGVNVVDSFESTRFVKLQAQKIPFAYLRIDTKDCAEYVRRLKARGLAKSALDRFHAKIKEHYYLIPDQDAAYRIVMQRGEYLSDYLWRIFGYPPKYIQCQQFDPLKYKIVFIKLKSLFVKNLRLSRFTQQTIKQLKSRVRIVLMTADDFATIKPCLKKLGLYHTNQIVICENGKTITNGKGMIIESIPENRNWAKAMRLVMDSCQVLPDNAVVIGEWKHNTDILSAVGCSVVIGNYQNQEAKQAAQYLTDSHYADGAARALRKIFGLK